MVELTRLQVHCCILHGVVSSHMHCQVWSITTLVFHLPQAGLAYCAVFASLLKKRPNRAVRFRHFNVNVKKLFGVRKPKQERFENKNVSWNATRVKTGIWIRALTTHLIGSCRYGWWLYDESRAICGFEISGVCAFSPRFFVFFPVFRFSIFGEKVKQPYSYSIFSFFCIDFN